MKKVLFIFFLIFFCYFLPNKRIETTTTFIEYNNSYNKYDVNIYSCNITTKNINNIFSNYNIKIVALYPYIEKYYKNILSNDLEYFYIENIKDLSSFNNYYKRLLKKLGLNNNANLININGIRLEKIIIYSKYNEFNRLKSKFSCIQ